MSIRGALTPHRQHRQPHSWTGGQAARTDHTVKDDALEVFHDDAIQSLKADVAAFVTAYNFFKHF